MSDLDSKTIRKSLEPGKRHQEPLAEGRYLVYRKAPTVQTGIWSVKYWDAVAKKSHLAKLAMADDVLDANGSDILTYDQAVKAADGKLKAMLREADLIAGGEEVFTGSYTVDQAWADYITDAKRLGRWSKRTHYALQRIMGLMRSNPLCGAPTGAGEEAT